MRPLRLSMHPSETQVADATGAIALNGRDISYAQGRVDAADKELASLRPLIAELERRRVAVNEARRVLTAADELVTTRSFLLRQSVEVGGAKARLNVDTGRREVEIEKAKEDALRNTIARLERALGDNAQVTLTDAAAALVRAEANLVESGKAHARAFDLEQERAKHVEAIAVATADLDAAKARLASFVP